MVKEFLNTKLATVSLSLVLILVMIITAKILVQKRVIDREVAKLQDQTEKIKKDNEQLSSLIQYLNTPEYKEKEAREKLNLVKEGEHVVVLPQGDVSGATNSKEDKNRSSNYKVWLDYFFHVN
jgi:cell division protein FtsB